MTTMIDVARKAGVSQTAVSFVLNRDPRAEKLRRETCEKVLKVARELDYHPNQIARSLRTGKSHSISVVAGLTHEVAFAQIVGFTSHMRDQGYMTNLTFNPWTGQEVDEDMARKLMAEIVKSNPEGVAILNGPPVLAAMIANRPKGQSIPCFALEIDAPGVDSLFIDRFTGTYEAVKYLLEKRGRERVAYLGPRGNFRWGGYCQAVEDAGKEPIALPGLEKLTENDSFPVGVRSAEALMELPSRPDAVQCYNDDMAVGVLTGLRERGVRVPDDMAVIGFNDVKIATMCQPRLTTIAQAKEEAGRRVAENLLKKINGEPAPEGGWNATLPTKLVIRESA